VLHTPGHFAGHLAFAVGDAVLTGDHVMDWASTLVSPPDGDVAAFMETSARLRSRGSTGCSTLATAPPSGTRSHASTG
jgi:glyoxylase-like metal-dependent hydrolase (beta-lactamase superfamily II)